MGGRKREFPEGLLVSGVEIVDGGVHVQDLAAEDAHEARAGPGGHDLGAQLVHQGLGANLLDGVENGIGDLGQRLVPGDPLPAPLTSLTGAAQRVLDPVRSLHLQAPGQTLLANHRIHVGDAGLDLLAHARGLLPHDLAILHQHVDRAVPGYAVDAVGPKMGLVPFLPDASALALLGRVGLAGGHIFSRTLSTSTATSFGVLFMDR